MPRKSFLSVPANLDDKTAVRRFLEDLIKRIDIAYNNRGDDPFAKDSQLGNYALVDGARSFTGVLSYVGTVNIVDSDTSRGIPDVQFNQSIYLRQDGTKSLTAVQSYSSAVSLAAGSNQLAYVGWIESNFTNNVEQAAVANLNQTISAAYVQAEVQAISDKVDETLAALRGADIIAV